MNLPFDFSIAHVLENERALLRPLETADYAHLLPFALHEPTLWQYSLIPIIGAKGLEMYVETALAGRQAKYEYAFSVYDKLTQQYAGCTRFYDIQIAHQTLQLGYTWYGKDFQGTNLNKHCKFLLLQFAFEQANMLRVEFRADVNNTRSINAMKSLGCTVEGILRSHLSQANGGRRDSIVLSILKDEWENNIKQRLIHQQQAFEKQ